MGDAKHTPGPWLVSDGWEPNPHAVVDTQCVYGPPRIGVVAHVVMAAQDGGHREERKANARLIAGAPDLVEVLLRAAANYRKLANEDFRADPVAAASWGAEEDRVRAVLFKAGV